MMSTLVVGAAGADPKGEAIPLECDNGKSYTVNTNGNGEFTPGLVADGTAVFVPIAFGDFSFTVTDGSGNVVDSGTEPGAAKGQSAKGVKDAVTCTFSFSGTEDGFTFTGSGSVVARITPSR